MYTYVRTPACLETGFTHDSLDLQYLVRIDTRSS